MPIIHHLYLINIIQIAILQRWQFLTHIKTQGIKGLIAKALLLLNNILYAMLWIILNSKNFFCLFNT